MSFEKFSNRASTTLNGNINNSVTSLVVTSASSFPSSGNFRLLIDDELMLVTAVSGTTFTITRGVESTTAASHTSGINIYGVLTKGALDWRYSNLILPDNYTDTNNTINFTPISDNPGRLILNQNGYLFYDDGTEFLGCGAVQRIYTPITNSLTHITGTSSSAKQLYSDSTGTYIQDTNTSSPANRYIFWTMPFIDPGGHNPWILGKFLLSAGGITADHYSTGLVILDSTNDNRVIFELEFNTGLYYFKARRIKADGTIDADLGTLGFSTLMDNNAIKWMGMRYRTGFHIDFYVSFDGNNPLKIWEIFDSAWVPATIDHYGVFINAYNNESTQITATVPYLEAGGAGNWYFS